MLMQKTGNPNITLIPLLTTSRYAVFVSAYFSINTWVCDAQVLFINLNMRVKKRLSIYYYI